MQFLYADDYPNCDAYFRNGLTVLESFVPKTWNAFVEVCGSEELAQIAVTPNEKPLVYLNSSLKSCGAYRGRVGGAKHAIEVAPDILACYEENRTWLKLEATVLHELVHWARFIRGLESRYNGKEAGEAFELSAYKKVVNCSCGTP